MLTISDMAYTVISVFSVTPPMLLENAITFVRRSCMLAVFRSRIEGAAPLQSFRSKTEGSWCFVFSFKSTGFRTATSFGFSFRNRRCRMAPPRAFSFKNTSCVVFPNEGVICTRESLARTRPIVRHNEMYGRTGLFRFRGGRQRRMQRRWRVAALSTLVLPRSTLPE